MKAQQQGEEHMQPELFEHFRSGLSFQYFCLLTFTRFAPRRR